MITLFSGLICLSVGLYAGKRRASGMSWAKIVREMAVGLFTFFSDIVRKMCYPFRKGRDGSKEEVATA